MRNKFDDDFGPSGSHHVYQIGKIPMSEQKRRRGLGLILLLGGIIVGLVLGAGMDLTNSVLADALSEAEEATESTESSPDEAVSSLFAISNAFADVAAEVNPSVVTISTQTTVETVPNGFAEFFQFRDPGPRPQSGLGSGVIVRQDGIILTNNHVVTNADNIVVRLLDGREFEAEIRGTDPRTDLAVIKISAGEQLPAIDIGDSDATRVGEWVLAIGSPLEAAFAHTVTSGIVSAKGRTGVGLTAYEDFIQTDAAINPGNSGGALVNLKGELIGINTAIASRSGGSIGIGFAIPARLARKVMSDILERGKVVRGWLGVQIANISQGYARQNNLSSSEGVYITSVLVDGPADKAGLEAGDIVVAIDGKRIRNATELSTRIGATEPDTRISMAIIRNSREREVTVLLEEFPEDEAPLSLNNAFQFQSMGFEVESLTAELRRDYDLSERDRGALVTRVRERGVADRHGLQEGDLIVRLNRQEIGAARQLSSLISELRPGDPLALLILRNNRKVFLTFDVPEE